MIELDGTALHWTGLPQSELNFSRLQYTAPPWIELESTIQDSTWNCIPRFQMKEDGNTLIYTSLTCKKTGNEDW